MEKENTAETAENVNPVKTKSAVVKRVINIVINVIIYAFFALCVIALIFSLTLNKGNGDDTRMRIVISSSMERNENTYPEIKQYKIKSIPVRTMVFIQLVPEDEAKKQEWYSSLKVGDVLTFKYYEAGKQEVITHRIISIVPNADGKGYTVTLEGDNVENGIHQVIDTSEDETSYNYILGKVTGTSVVLGNLVYAIKQPIGLALIIIVPCAIIIIMQLIRVFTILSSGKKQKAEEIQLQQSSEIEELKRKLAELESGKTQTDGNIQPNEEPSGGSDDFESELDEPVNGGNIADGENPDKGGD